MADKISNNSEVSTTELAAVLGLTGRRIRQLAEDGVLDKIKDGRFNLCESVQKYINSVATSKNSEMSKQEIAKQDAEVSIKKAKL